MLAFLISLHSRFRAHPSKCIHFYAIYSIESLESMKNILRFPASKTEYVQMHEPATLF